MHLTQDQILQYHNDGYTIVENLFTPEEVDVLIKQINIDDPKAGGFSDGGGKAARLAFWWETQSTIWGAASRHPNVLNAVRILMQEDVAFFHGKVTLKEARTGGAWEWHQDYGYWYDQGFVFPRMMSVSVSLDTNTIENGCMQLLKGTHKLGRINHGRVGSQTGVDPDRLKAITPYFENVPAIMKPGAGLFFHCNTLHASSANQSDKHRRNFIMCYNAVNNPQIPMAHGAENFPCPVGSPDVILDFAKNLATV